LDNVIQQSGFRYLPVRAAHAFATGDLPDHHRDPFDRMLVAQAVVENATLITRDTSILQYPAPCIGA
jgi:PIN domain nuclease of toxin-antitoxin system